jgi:hypothetical protein
MGKSGGQEGVRKDSISHGIRSSIMAMGGYPAYFLDMRKKLPTKFADMVSKYIPQEIEHINAPPVNVLNITYAEPRQLARDVRELDVIAVDGCKADSTVEEPEDAV